jgi:hypothetical protein
MNWYFEKKKSQYEGLKKTESRFARFCNEVYGDESLKLDPSEKKHFEELREIEAKDYKFRETVFWPVGALSLLVFDQLVTMPATKNNKARILYNIILGIPTVTLACSGLIFYKDTFESHEYAISLCDKYNRCNEIDN